MRRCARPFSGSVQCNRYQMMARSVSSWLRPSIVAVESHEDALVKRDMDDKEYRGSTRRDNDTRPISLPQRVRVHPWCIALRVSRIFSEFSAIGPGRGETASRHSRPSSASKSCLSASSSLPFHVIVFALYLIATSVLTLIPGDPSTRVVAFVTCRKCFSSMREKGSPSRRIGVSFASF